MVSLQGLGGNGGCGDVSDYWEYVIEKGKERGLLMMDGGLCVGRRAQIHRRCFLVPVWAGELFSGGTQLIVVLFDKC